MKLSVAVCTFNGEKYISEQLNSIINQTLAVNEIIICDDQSSDSTIEIINSFIEKYPTLIKLYQNKINLNVNKNFEKAITLSTGDYIFLSDQDDVWEKNSQNELSKAIFIDRKEMVISNIEASKVYQAFIGIGGENGWFDFDFLWELRGIIDKLIGGVGLKRGRRSQCDLRISDCLDFWKVVDLKKDERLLLYAQMKLPGEAWLEFKIKDNKLIQSAYFYPKGVFGRLYWYALVPLHYFIFKNMIKSIIQKAKNLK